MSESVPFEHRPFKVRPVISEKLCVLHVSSPWIELHEWQGQDGSPRANTTVIVYTETHKNKNNQKSILSRNYWFFVAMHSIHQPEMSSEETYLTLIKSRFSSGHRQVTAKTPHLTCLFLESDAFLQTSFSEAKPPSLPVPIIAAWRQGRMLWRC